MMYEKLVKRLRLCAEGFRCRECDYENVRLCRWKMNNEAADAIEELIRKVDASIPKSDAEIIISEVAKKQPMWIPVTEFPPEGETYGDTAFSVEVLGTEGFTYRKAYYNFKYEVWIDGNEEQEWPSITYWMPLPEPPREEQK